MKKTSYKQPVVDVVQMLTEDVVRTSNNAVGAFGDAVFDGYSTELWS